MSRSTQAAVAERPRLGSGQMFDDIAARYDRMNRILSLGIDRLWRRRLVAALGELAPGDEVLDLATGTADVALAIARQREGVQVVGVDPSAQMLAVGQKKVDRAGLSDRITLAEGDAMALDHADGRFAAAAISFGIRNVPDRTRGLAEMARVVRPGGHVVVLELSEPEGGVMATLARWHVHHVVPRVGGWLSGSREYRYLQESIAAFPKPGAFAAMMEAAGLDNVRARRMTFGTVHVFSGVVRG